MEPKMYEVSLRLITHHTIIARMGHTILLTVNDLRYKFLKIRH
jgi:hypothetical protein